MKGRDTMARPAISGKTTSKHLTKSEADAKIGTEEKLRGSAAKVSDCFTEEDLQVHREGAGGKFDPRQP